MQSVSALVGELAGAIDRLLAADVSGLDADELQNTLRTVQHQRDRLAVVAGDVVRRWDESECWRHDGSLRATWALGRDTRCSDEHAALERRRSRALHRMPFVRAAVLDGRLSMDHLDLFVRAATEARRALFERDESLLVEACARLEQFDDARRTVRYWMDLADDELGKAPRPPRPSTLYSSRHGLTGELVVNGTLSPIDGEIVTNELARLMKQLRLEDRANGVTRTRAQLRAAALVLMATRSVNATGVTPRPLFQVIVGDATARHLCELASGAIVHHTDLVPHIDDAVMERFLFDGPSTIISTSTKRTFTGALRRAIQVRDRRCRHRSGCRIRAGDADVDHVVPARHGGPTSQFNGRIECIPHNRHDDLQDDAAAHAPPGPERSITVLDEIRGRVRWQVQNDERPARGGPFEWLRRQGSNLRPAD